MSENNYILDVQHLCQTFTSGRGRKKITVKAVDDVTFGIRPAETFGLVGESGCGLGVCPKNGNAAFRKPFFRQLRSVRMPVLHFTPPFRPPHILRKLFVEISF